MAHISEDRVLETAVPVATTAFTLAGAVTGFRTFSSQLATNDTCYYAAQEVDANGSPTGNWENGLATLTAATTLTRNTVIESSNANNPVTFGAGTVQVAIGLLAMRNVHYDNNLAVWLQAATVEPPDPPSGNLYIYAKNVLPEFTAFKVKRPSGVDTPLQDALMFNRVIKFQASNNTLAPTGSNGNLTIIGTGAAVVFSSGSAKTAIQRLTVTSAATAGALAGYHVNNTQWSPMFRGGVNGEGGFRFHIKFSLQTLVANNRGYFGIVDTTAAPTNVDPTTNATPGKIGLAFNANTGNLRLVHNVSGTAPTVIDLGANFPINTTDLIDLTLACRPFSTTAGAIGYRVRRFTTSSATPAAEVTGTISTNIPASTSLLHPVMWMTNNATAAAVAFQLSSFTTESDN